MFKYKYDQIKHFEQTRSKKKKERFLFFKYITLNSSVNN